MIACNTVASSPPKLIIRLKETLKHHLKWPISSQNTLVSHSSSRSHTRVELNMIFESKSHPGPKALPSEMISVALRPNIRVVEGKMAASDLALLTKWIELNHDVLLNYWEEDIDTKRRTRRNPAPQISV